MSELEFVCLANSRKMGGRCIAGIRVPEGGWIRPVGPTGSGELHPQHYRLEDGTEPELLDTLAIRLGKPKPESYQPENWTIVNKPWRRVHRAGPVDIAGLLRSHVHPEGPLFGTTTDRVEEVTFEATPATYSLTLVAPHTVAWEATRSMRGRRQARARFEWNGVTYDLVVTDPFIEDQLRRLPVGDHSSNQFGFDRDERFLLTLSLGEPFEGSCFKLVAAAIPFPRVREVARLAGGTPGKVT